MLPFDIAEIIEHITDFPRFWRLYAGVIATFVGSALIAKNFDSPREMAVSIIVTLVIGVILSIIWQNAGSRQR